MSKEKIKGRIKLGEARAVCADRHGEENRK